MRKIYKLSLAIFLALTIPFSLLAQNNFFTGGGQNKMVQTTGLRKIFPEKFNASSLNVQAMRMFLWNLPLEGEANLRRGQMPVITVPMPDGSQARFRVWQSSVMEPGLEAKFPEMKTFAGQGIDDPYATIRMDYNPYSGFHAQILSAKTGNIYIDPYAGGDIDNYMSYFTRDNVRSTPFTCQTEAQAASIITPPSTEAAGPCRGTELFTYRLALACTGEYATAVCLPSAPTVPATAAAMLTTVNRVVGVYEKEVALRMVLIANNDLLIYLDGTGDPYTNNNGNTMLGQNQNNIDAVIGSANYDIGHVVSTGGGGVATLRSPCNPAWKARGVTGLTNPVGDNFDIDYVAHEMGHQWGGNHTFNSLASNCGAPNRNASTAYEVGSGTTIQAYAGICAADNIQPHSDPYFHTVSFDEISTYIGTGGGGNGCKVATATGNTLPVITAMNGNSLSIPVNTPFTLTGSATDADGDAITYNWEQWDIGASTTWNGGAATTTSPLFKSRIPKLTGSRTFPDPAIIAANYPANPAAVMDGLKGEVLPTVARVMKFRLTVRDNRAAGGGVVTGGDGCQTGFNSIYQINVVGTTPFTVLSPNGGESFPGGSTQTITWNTAGTDAAPFNVANVRISLSTDGGLTFPTEIIASTPNDGSEALVLPAVAATTTARIKIEAINNVFFDISNTNFSLTVPLNGFEFGSPAAATAACPAPTSMDITLGTSVTGTFSTPIVLSATGNPAGTTVSFSPSPVTPGNSTVVTLNGTNTLGVGSYTITVTGTAGAVVRTRTLTYTITGGAGPSITTPPSNQTICAGDNTSFTVVSPTATSIKWQVNPGSGFVDIANGGVYSGATTGTLTITGATTAMSGYLYRAVASVLCGVTNSASATLTVNSAPSINIQPADATICAGNPQSFTVGATGTPTLTYQWQVSTDGGNNYNNISNGVTYSGVTTSSMTVNNVIAGQNGYRFRAVVNGVCPPAVNSNGAILTVVTAVTVTTQPTAAIVCVGGTTSFTVAGSGTGILYQWQVDPGTGFVNVANNAIYSGATSATLTITGATAGMNNYQFRAQLSNSTCLTPGTSNAATLTVNTLPAITTSPANSTICIGGNTTFTGAATGTGVTYQWQVNPGTGFVNVANGGVYSGATTGTLTITGAIAAMNTYQYRLVASGTCAPAANSTAATLTVVNPVAITTQPAATVQVCSGSTTTISVVATSTETINYQWQVNTGSGFTNIANAAPYSTATTATLTITNAPVTLNGYQYRVVMTNTSCTAPVNSNATALTVRQLPTVGLTASPVTSLLPGQTTTLTATPSASTGGTLSIQWLFNTVPISNTGNIRPVIIEGVGDYQVNIQEVFGVGAGSITCANTSPRVTITAEQSSRLFIFPSPNDGQFTVSFYNAGGATTSRSITVFNSNGAKVYSAKVSQTGLYTLIPVNIKPAASGVYHVVVGDASNKKIATGSIVVQ